MKNILLLTFLFCLFLVISGCDNSRSKEKSSAQSCDSQQSIDYKLQSENEALKKQLSSLSKDYSSLMNDYDNLNDEYDDLNDEYDDLNDEYDSLYDDYFDKENEADDYRFHASELERQIFEIEWSHPEAIDRYRDYRSDPEFIWP